MAGSPRVGSSSSTSDPMAGVEIGQLTEKPRGRLRKYVRKVKRLFKGEHQSRSSPDSIPVPTPSTDAPSSPSPSPATPLPDILPSIEEVESRNPQEEDSSVVEATESSIPTVDAIIKAADTAIEKALPEPAAEESEQISPEPVVENSEPLSSVPAIETPTQISSPVIESSDRISPEPFDASDRISPEPALERPRKFSEEPDWEREANTLTSVDRIRRLGEPWDLSIEPHEWGYSRKPANVSRVERPIRARIHRMCHRCSTGFGATKICANCGHSRCKLCPRLPNIRTEEAPEPEAPSAATPPEEPPSQPETVPSPEVADMAPAQESTGAENAVAEPFIQGPTSFNAPIQTLPAEASSSTAIGGMVGGVDLDLDDFESLRRKYIMSRPVRTGGQTLVKKKPMQRVRRTCHECQALFQPNSRSCPKCGHLRCDDCPRDPPKRHKYPNGYPGDTPVITPRLISRSCHYCSHLFPPIPRLPGSADRLSNIGIDGEPIECTNCGHIQCHECQIESPKIIPPPVSTVTTSSRSRVAQLGPTAGS